MMVATKTTATGKDTGSIKKKLIDTFVKYGELSELELIKDKKNYQKMRFVISDLYNHGFLYSKILRTPDNLIATTDKMLYRVFFTTQKFKDAVEKGEKIE